MAFYNDNNLTLKVEGNAFKGAWAGVHVRRSMRNICGAFALSNVDFFTNNNAINIYMGSEVELDIDGQLICTGYIDNMDVIYNADEQIVHIKGRDNTGDLVDCVHVANTNEWKKQKISDIIKALLNPFGISLSIDSSVTSLASTVIPEFKVNEGQVVFDLISELCIDNGMLPLNYGDGSLTLTKVTTSRKAYDAIEIGINATDGSYIQSDINRYSDYYVKGLGVSNDNKTLADYIEPMGEATDSVITRHRPFVMFSDRATDSGKCSTRAKWEAGLRAGYSRILKYEVTEWTQSNGDIWDINTLVKVKDTFLGVDDTFLISDIDYIYDEDSLRTILYIVDKDTFSGDAEDVKIKTGLFDA